MGLEESTLSDFYFFLDLALRIDVIASGQIDDVY
jgi:hypothetical protein